jgi:hypothetical protein
MRMNDERIEAIERRLRELEDTVAIYQLVASYGPSIDGGASPEAGLLWTEDAWYDSDSSSAGAEGVHGREGINGIADMVAKADIGIAHITHLPIVDIDGDRATVTGHSNTFHQVGDEFHVARVSANRWELERTDGRWHIKRRTNRILNGTAESKEVLARGVRDDLAAKER